MARRGEKEEEEEEEEEDDEEEEEDKEESTTPLAFWRRGGGVGLSMESFLTFLSISWSVDTTEASNMRFSLLFRSRSDEGEEEEESRLNNLKIRAE